MIVLLSVSIVSANDGLDSLLEVSRERSGTYAPGLFSMIDSCENYGLSAIDEADLRFLLAYLPLGDIPAMDSRSLLENVRLAREARDRFSWGSEVPDDIYRHFVLPHRISQEPFVNGWRSQFLEELTPRVKNMSMNDAALEVNHWCHENATFKQTSARDQDPLTTIRVGYGRCEEEMILSIAALRSIGIPARQCYTPYWPHTDNNHAWVEVWTEDGWHYFGACEPEPVLNQAWFTEAAARAMAVVSTAYGDYRGDEPVLRRYSRSTLLNSTAVYGNARELEVTLVDHKGKPIADQRVIFSLFNYGFLNAALSKYTDESGVCRITCGVGDWIISAGKKKWSALKHVTSDQNTVTLTLDKTERITDLTSIDYHPPVKPSDFEKITKDSLFLCRTAGEDSIRKKNLWNRWIVEASISGDENLTVLQLDSILAGFIAQAVGVDTSKVLELFENARGNWGLLYRFMTGMYPVQRQSETEHRVAQDFPVYQQPARWLLLETLSDKDLRDFTLPMLEDHFLYSTLGNALSAEGSMETITELDSSALQREKDYVISPRIRYEPSSAWRNSLCDFLTARPKLITSRKDKALIKWLQKNISIEEKPDRLGPGMTPATVITLGRGTIRDISTAYVGLCRVRGIPARFNPVSGQLERWDDDDWTVVQLFKKGSKAKKIGRKGLLTIEADSSDSTATEAKYFQEWAVQRWETDVTDAVDFGFKKPYKEMSWHRELPVGLYCMTTGVRREDGSAPIALTWFEIKAGKETRIDLLFKE